MLKKSSGVSAFAYCSDDGAERRMLFAYGQEGARGRGTKGIGRGVMTAGSTQRPEGLTRDNAILLLVDHQVGLYTGIRDIDVLQLKHNVVGLTRAMLALKVPRPRPRRYRRARHAVQRFGLWPQAVFFAKLIEIGAALE